MRVPNLVLAFCVYTAAYSNDNNGDIRPTSLQRFPQEGHHSIESADVQQRHSYESAAEVNRKLYDSITDRFAALFTSSNLKKSPKVSLNRDNQAMCVMRKYSLANDLIFL
jgi:DNA topoisomerase IA